MTTSKFSSAWLPALAGPVILAAAAVVLALGPRALSRHFWPTPDTNIAEAAAMRDSARVRAEASRGVPLDRPYPIRPGLVDNAPPSLTLEDAARLGGSEALIRLVQELTP